MDLKTIEDNIQIIIKEGGSNDDVRRYLDSKKIKYETNQPSKIKETMKAGFEKVRAYLPQAVESLIGLGLEEDLPEQLLAGAKETLERRQAPTELEKRTGAGGFGKRVAGEALEAVPNILTGIAQTPSTFAKQFLPAGLAKADLGKAAKGLASDLIATGTDPYTSFTGRPIESSLDVLLTADLMQAGIKGITRAKPTRTAAKETLAFTTGVPKESLQRAFDRPLKVLADRKERAVADTALRAKEGFKFLQKKENAALNAEIRSLKDIKTTIDPTPIVKKATKNIAIAQSDAKILSKGEVAQVTEIINDLVNGKLTPSKAHKITRKIDGIVKFGEKAPTTPGVADLNNILKEIRYDLKTILRENPKYRIANEKVSKLKSLNEKLKSGFKDERIESFIGNIAKKDVMEVAPTRQDIVRRGYLEELDKLLPKKYKFLDEMKDTLAGAEFESIFPRKSPVGGLTGGGLFLASFLTKNPALLLGLPGVSPAILGKTIKGASQLGRTGSVAGPALRLPALLEQMGRQKGQ